MGLFSNNDELAKKRKQKEKEQKNKKTIDLFDFLSDKKKIKNKTTKGIIGDSKLPWT